MAQSHRESHKHRGFEARASWAAERQILLDNLLALRETSMELASKAEELKDLKAAVDRNMADAHSIRVYLNRTAKRFGLQPIEVSERKR